MLAYLNFCFLFFCMTEALLDLGNSANFHGFGIDSTYRPILWIVLWPFLIHQMMEVSRPQDKVMPALMHGIVTK